MLGVRNQGHLREDPSPLWREQGCEAARQAVPGGWAEEPAQPLDGPWSALECGEVVVSFRCQACGGPFDGTPNRTVTQYRPQMDGYGDRATPTGHYEIAQEKNLCATCAPKLTAEKPARVVRAPKIRRHEPEAREHRS